jgi:hypothetical protein
MWRKTAWFVIDLRGNVRAKLRGFLKSEAERAAALLFGDEDLHVECHEGLNKAQRRGTGHLTNLTPQKCIALLGGGIDLIDPVARRREAEDLLVRKGEAGPERLKARAATS